jgi:ABC-2 type transport system permease protein
MSGGLRRVLVIARREFLGYFATPLAVVFLVIFLSVALALPFYAGNFFARDQADLMPFFTFHPWLFMVLVPAIGMRLWSEERKTGTLEILMTLPLSTAEAVAGKFLAAWAFLTLALALTFPIWITVNYLGRPDNGVIISSYIGSWLLAGAMLSISSCFSAATRNQVIAFIMSVVASFLLMIGGLDMVTSVLQGWLPPLLTELISSFSLVSHFATATRGVIDLKSLFYFFTLMGLFLFATGIVLEAKKVK